jgi:cytochrome c peroxidase
VATGVAGLRGGRNVPTVWNSAFRRALFWDGRAGSLEEQAQGPLLNPVEMGNPDARALVASVTAIPAYRAALERVFGGTGIAEIARALAAYERTLVTPRSPFDRFHAGEAGALGAQEKRGWEKFQARGCVACHGAPTFTGEDYFIRFPLYSIPEEDRRHGFTRDLGRYEATRAPWDKNRWRVPSLRNVALTAPYLHNGALTELAEVVRLMGKAQLNKVLPEDDIADIVAFLRSLTGVPPAEEPPTLPE